MDKLRVGELFAGIGGFGKGLEDTGGFEVVWQVENNEYCRKVLNKHWPAVPCHGDITTIDWRDIPAVDLVCGGFPCQPFSVAGKRAGTADNRYLWPEVVRCLDTLRPTWFLGENVPGLINLALDQVCTDLEGLGYQVWPVCLPACAVDAPHIRQRVWIVGHASGNRWRGRARFGTGTAGEVRDTGEGESEQSVAHAGSTGRRSGTESRSERQETTPRSQDVADAIQLQRHGWGDGVSWWAREPLETLQDARRNGRQEDGLSIPESCVGGVAARLSARMDGDRLSVWPSEPAEIPRVATGVKHRVDRLKGLGNAVVPQVVEALGRMILEADESR